MVELLEYQAKRLFQQVGIPTLPSQVIRESREIRGLEIPYPIVLKSQVPAPGRAKAGGIRFAENTIDAIAATQTILNLSILGKYPEVVLAEARYNTKKELFLAIVLDYEQKCPVLLGSSEGGVNLEALFNHLEMVKVEQDFSPYYARRLARQMGLTGDLMVKVSEVIENMYTLFLDKDLEIIEINPLGIGPTGKVMALDGKITAHDDGLARQADLLVLVEKPLEKFPCWIGERPSQALTGVIVNSLGVGLATLDLLEKNSLEANCCLVIESEESALTVQLQEALEELRTIPELEVILINLIMPRNRQGLVIESLKNWQAKPPTIYTAEERIERPTGANYRAKSPRQLLGSFKFSLPDLPIVIRLLGTDLETSPESLASLPLYWVKDLEAALEQIYIILQENLDQE